MRDNSRARSAEVFLQSNFKLQALSSIKLQTPNQLKQQTLLYICTRTLTLRSMNLFGLYHAVSEAALLLAAAISAVVAAKRNCYEETIQVMSGF